VESDRGEVVERLVKVVRQVACSLQKRERIETILAL
jgi:hypothetical protein